MAASVPEHTASESGVASVFIVDDHPIVRQGLTHLIGQEDGFALVGEAEDAEQALQDISRLKPDIALVDIVLPNSNGFELIRKIARRNKSTACIVLSVHDEASYCERALAAGAKGYIIKREAPSQIVHGMRMVLEGEVYVCSKMVATLLNKLADTQSESTPTAVDKLSNRELEVFELIGQGYGTRQIAEQLMISVKTVETYKGHIKTKLGIESASDLNREAIAWAKQSIE